MKRILQIILQEIMKKNNTWTIRQLENETIVPSTQRPSILYWRLLDFCSFRIYLVLFYCGDKKILA